MKVPSLLILTLLVTNYLAGCSTLPQKDIQLSDLSADEQDHLNREALAIASKRLEQMVGQAKGNPETINYLATDLFLKANMSLMESDFTTAATLFKYVVDLAPEDEFVQKKYAIALIRTGNLEDAQIALEKLYGQSKEEKVGMILAGVYTGLDQEEKARTLYQSLLTKNPSNEDACIFLGKSFALSKENDKAHSLLNSCAKRDPKNGIYDYYVGKLFIDQGQIPKAIEAFKKAHNRQPSLTQAVSALGVIYEEREQYDSAIALYKGHLKVKSEDSSILARIVHVLFLKEKYNEVIPYAETLSDIEPDNLNLKVKLGILYTDAKKYPEAISVFKDLLGVAPQSDKILYYLGAIHQEMKEFQESIEYFNQIPSSSGLYTDSSVQMANMLSSLAMEEHTAPEKNTFWEKQFLLHVNKKIADLKEMRVEFSVIKAGYFEAVAKFKDAMEAMMVVQDEKNFSTQHKYYLANLYEKENKFAESTALIMGIIEKEPKNAHAWNFLGYSLVVRGEEMDKAYEYIKTAMEISPEDGYIRDSLGWYYFKKGDVSKALSHLEYAFKKVPDDVEILKHLAQIHKELKDFSKARTYLQTALKHARYQSDRQEILSSIEKLDTDRVPASGKFD